VIRIAISAAFPAIRDSHPVGSRRSEPQRTASGNFFIWVPKCGWEAGPWYHQQTLERHALGFAQPDALARPSAAASLVESMRDLYRAWA
jgi:hypothetical protein